MSHPLGDLVSQHLHRKHGLSQSKLAAGILQVPTVISDMCRGRRLTGPQARERVIAIIGWLHQQGALDKLDEANALLNAAGMSPLNERAVAEATLIQALRPPEALRPSEASSRSTFRGAARHNLPAQLTSFIGRQDDIAEVTEQLKTARLLTLTGAGGVGKTRLALEIAMHLVGATDSVAPTFADGVWLVELAPLGDPTIVPKTVASALKLIDQPGRSHRDALVNYFEARHALLILDNCEHIINACAELAEYLLRRCAQLHILATSRETLRVPGEAAYRVPSLKTSDSVQLFVERAHSPFNVALTSKNDNGVAVAEVSRQLDGIPLAIELAAALTQTMTVEEIAAQLNKHLALSTLTNGYRTAEPRHQTMRNALDWSYDLLAPAEQRLLARLSVFAGGWMGEEAEKVCGDVGANGRSPLQREVLSLLNQLVQKSLVVTERQGEHMRYRLLEPIRQYSAQKLDEMSETDAVRRRHAQTYVELAEAAKPHLRDKEQRHWYKRLGREHDNIRAALTWSQSEAGGTSMGARLAAALWDYWWNTGDGIEGYLWVEAMLQRTDAETPPGVRAQLLLGLSILNGATAKDRQATRRWMGEALSLFRSVGDKAGIVWSACSLGPDGVEEGVAVARQSDVQPWVTAFALWCLANIQYEQGNADRAMSLYEESLACAREQGDANSIAPILITIGQVALGELDFAKTAALAEEALSVARESGICKSDEFWSLLLLADALRFRGEYDRATALVEQSYGISLEHGLVVLTPAALSAFGLLARDQGDYDCAAARFKESIVWHHDKLGRWADAINILELATVASVQEHHHRAAKLFGAHSTMLDAGERQRLGMPHNQRQFGAYIDATRAQLGNDAYDAAFAEGCAMTAEKAFEYALTNEGGRKSG